MLSNRVERQISRQNNFIKIKIRLEISHFKETAAGYEIFLAVGFSNKLICSPQARGSFQYQRICKTGSGQKGNLRPYWFR